MGIVKVMIQKDSSTVKYIKLIREFDASLSMGGIKKSIETGEPVLTFDLDSNAWIYMEGMTEFQYHRGFYAFLQTLRKAGAVLSLTLESGSGNEEHCREITMEELDRRIRFHKEIADEVEKYPD